MPGRDDVPESGAVLPARPVPALPGRFVLPITGAARFLEPAAFPAIPARDVLPSKEVFRVTEAALVPAVPDWEAPAWSRGEAETPASPGWGAALPGEDIRFSAP